MHINILGQWERIDKAKDEQPKSRASMLGTAGNSVQAKAVGAKHGSSETRVIYYLWC